MAQTRAEPGYPPRSSSSDIPQHALWHLQALAQGRYTPDLVHWWYRSVLNEYGPSSSSTPDSRSIGGLAQDQHESKKYACHRCWNLFKYAKDLHRHVFEICEPRQTWHCPDCIKVYNREDRFRQHHRSVHQCGTICRHAGKAVREHQPRQAHGCGICVTLIECNLELYLQHLVAHFNDGASIIDWSWTTQMLSLLRRPSVEAHWRSLCAARFGMQPHSWPTLQWDYQSAHPYITWLEGPVTVDVLQQHLLRLLELGLQHLQQSGLMPAISTPVPNQITPMRPSGYTVAFSERSGMQQPGASWSGPSDPALHNAWSSEAVDSLPHPSPDDAFTLMGSGFQHVGHQYEPMPLKVSYGLAHIYHNAAGGLFSPPPSCLPSPEEIGATDEHLLHHFNRAIVLRQPHECGSSRLGRRWCLPPSDAQTVPPSIQRRPSQNSLSSVDVEHD